MRKIHVAKRPRKNNDSLRHYRAERLALRAPDRLHGVKVVREFALELDRGVEGGGAGAVAVVLGRSEQGDEEGQRQTE